MITDPKTIPAGRTGRLAYAVGVGLLATLLIAPQTTEFGTKVAVLGALALVCAARPVAEMLAPRRGGAWAPGRRAAARSRWAARRRSPALVVLAGIPPAPTRPPRAPRGSPAPGSSRRSRSSRRRASRRDRPGETALRIAERPRRRSSASRRRRWPAATGSGAEAAAGARLAALWRQIDAAGGEVVVPDYNVERVELTLEPGDGQSPPLVVATLAGTIGAHHVLGLAARGRRRGDPAPSSRRSSSSSRTAAT